MAAVDFGVAEALPRTGTAGCWTGYAADMNMLNTVKRKNAPVYYLEQYPRHRATSLNTWLARFGLVSNGMFLELDRRGSVLVKELIKRSKTERGYVIRITGIRNGDKIKVQSATEVLPGTDSGSVDNISSSRLRGQFATMGI